MVKITKITRTTITGEEILDGKKLVGTITFKNWHEKAFYMDKKLKIGNIIEGYITPASSKSSHDIGFLNI